MYPTLYHALLDLFGLDLPFLKFVNSFGFFVAMAFMVAAWTLGLELKRKEAQGLVHATKKLVTEGAPAKMSELITSGLVGFLLGFKGLHLLLNFAEATANPQAFLLSGTGSFIGGLLVGAAFVWMRWRDKQKHVLEKPKITEVTVHPHERASDMALTAALWGFIGAKLFHWLENPGEMLEFLSHPQGKDLFSGLTMYGGLIVGGAMVIRYFVKNGIQPLAGMDAAAPGLMLAYAVGRIGCQISGDGDWGIVNAEPAPSWMPRWMWSYDYPNNVLGAGVPIQGDCFPDYCTHLVPGVYPTPLYELTACLVLGAVLWVIRKRTTIPGILFAIYLIMNGFERFWIEKIRVNTKVIGNITQAEIIAVLLMVLGIGMIIWLKKRASNPATHGPA